jgi:hypothetical protein
LVEDRIRAAKDTGLRNLPFRDMAQNRIWVAISALAQDLLAWCSRLALPAPATSYEPKRLRLRILAVAGRIVRTARRRVLHIDPDHRRSPRAPTRRRTTRRDISPRGRLEDLHPQVLTIARAHAPRTPSGQSP